MAETSRNRKRKNKTDDSPLVFPDKLCIKYLNAWIEDSNAQPNVLIHKYNFFSKPPNEIYAEIEDCEENGGAYFFCIRDKKDQAEKCNIPKRNLTAGEGYWTTKGGIPREILRAGVMIGYRQMLSFYHGNVKTEYLAHEYTKHTPDWTESFDTKAMYRLYKSRLSRNKKESIQEEDEQDNDGLVIVEGGVKSGELEPGVASCKSEMGEEEHQQKTTDKSGTGEEEREKDNLIIEKEGGVKENTEMEQHTEENMDSGEMVNKLYDEAYISTIQLSDEFFKALAPFLEVEDQQQQQQETDKKET